MPRRKYGRMQKPIPPVAPEKCRLCRLPKPCPIHARSGRARVPATPG